MGESFYSNTPLPNLFVRSAPDGPSVWGLMPEVWSLTVSERGIASAAQVQV
jgi:hypothetical protein